MSFSWKNGRILTSVTTSDTTVNMEYNCDGLRTQKSYMSSPTSSNKVVYFYDSEKRLSGIDQNGTAMYFYYPVNMSDYSGNIPYWIITGVIHLGIAGNAGLRGWAWFYKAKSAISLAGNTYLTYKGYSLSCALFNHAMWGHGRKLSSSTNNLIIKKLRASKTLKNAISKIIKNVKGNSVNKNNTVEFPNKEADLYYSLQHIALNVKGRKRIRGTWSLTITVKDWYNFDNIRSFSKLSFGNAANDLGWAMQGIGMVVPFSISVSYTTGW